MPAHTHAAHDQGLPPGHERLRRRRVDPTHIILAAVGGVGIFVVLILAVSSANREALGFEEFKAKLSTKAGGGTAFRTLTQAEFLQVATPRSHGKAGSFLYFYFSVKEGTAVVTIEADSWDRNTLRIQSVQRVP